MVYSIKKRKREKPSYCNFHAKKNEKEYVVTSVIPTLKHASNHPSKSVIRSMEICDLLGNKKSLKLETVLQIGSKDKLNIDGTLLLVPEHSLHKVFHHGFPKKKEKLLASVSPPSWRVVFLCLSKKPAN